MDSFIVHPKASSGNGEILLFLPDDDLIYENMFATIIQMLNGDGMFPLSRQSEAVTDETTKNSIIIPEKYRRDIETLQVLYPDAFKNKTEIVMTLREALDVLPRDRERTDAYKTLAVWMNNNLNISLTIKSRKSKG